MHHYGFSQNWNIFHAQRFFIPMRSKAFLRFSIPVVLFLSHLYIWIESKLYQMLKKTVHIEGLLVHKSSDAFQWRSYSDQNEISIFMLLHCRIWQWCWNVFKCESHRGFHWEIWNQMKVLVTSKNFFDLFCDK